MGLQDHVKAYLVKGANLRTALVLATEVAKINAVDKMVEGVDVKAALLSTGFGIKVAAQIANRLGPQVAAADTVRVLTEIEREVRSGAAGIPTAECLHRHLPDPENFTEEEFRRAWEACEKG